MKRFIRYRDGENTLEYRPVDRLINISGNVAGQIDMYFKPKDGTIGNVDTVSLSVTDDKELEVMKAISNAVNFSTNPVVLIADDHTADYIHPNLDAVDDISNSTDTNPS